MASSKKSKSHQIRDKNISREFQVDPNARWLDLSGKELFNCPDLTSLNIVEELSLEKNVLSTLATLPSNLKKLSVKENKIAFLGNIGEMVQNLEFLNCSQNRLISLDGLEGCRALRELNISNNYVGDDQLHVLRTLVQIRILDISHNHLRDNEVFNLLSCLPHLEVLVSRDNDFSQIKFSSHMPALRELFIDGNKLKRLHFDQRMDTLTKLHAKDCSLSMISALENVPQLSELYIDNNQLVTLNEEINKLKILLILSASNNKLKSVANIDLPLLETVNVSYNNLESLDFIRDCSELKSLNAQYNRIVCFPECKLTNLMYLNMSNNSVAAMGGIERFQNLIFLNLSSNYLQDETALVKSVTKLFKLRHLDTRNNPSTQSYYSKKTPWVTASDTYDSIEYSLQCYEKDYPMSDLELASKRLMYRSSIVSHFVYSLQTLDCLRVTKVEVDKADQLRQQSLVLGDSSYNLTSADTTLNNSKSGAGGMNSPSKAVDYTLSLSPSPRSLQKLNPQISFQFQPQGNVPSNNSLKKNKTSERLLADEISPVKPDLLEKRIRMGEGGSAAGPGNSFLMFSPTSIYTNGNNNISISPNSRLLESKIDAESIAFYNVPDNSTISAGITNRSAFKTGPEVTEESVFIPTQESYASNGHHYGSVGEESQTVSPVVTMVTDRKLEEQQMDLLGGGGPEGERLESSLMIVNETLRSSQETSIANHSLVQEEGQFNYPEERQKSKNTSLGGTAKLSTGKFTSDFPNHGVYSLEGTQKSMRFGSRESAARSLASPNTSQHENLACFDQFNPGNFMEIKTEASGTAILIRDENFEADNEEEPESTFVNQISKTSTMKSIKSKAHSPESRQKSRNSSRRSKSPNIPTNFSESIRTEQNELSVFSEGGSLNTTTGLVKQVQQELEQLQNLKDKLAKREKKRNRSNKPRTPNDENLGHFNKMEDSHFKQTKAKMSNLNNVEHFRKPLSCNSVHVNNNGNITNATSHDRQLRDFKKMHARNEMEILDRLARKDPNIISNPYYNLYKKMASQQLKTEISTTVEEDLALIRRTSQHTPTKNKKQSHGGKMRSSSSSRRQRSGRSKQRRSATPEMVKADQRGECENEKERRDADKSQDNRREMSVQVSPNSNGDDHLEREDDTTLNLEANATLKVSRITQECQTDNSLPLDLSKIPKHSLLATETSELEPRILSSQMVIHTDVSGNSGLSQTPTRVKTGTGNERICPTETSEGDISSLTIDGDKSRRNCSRSSVTNTGRSSIPRFKSASRDMTPESIRGQGRTLSLETFSAVNVNQSMLSIASRKTNESKIGAIQNPFPFFNWITEIFTRFDPENSGFIHCKLLRMFLKEVSYAAGCTLEESDIENLIEEYADFVGEEQFSKDQIIEFLNQELAISIFFKGSSRATTPTRSRAKQNPRDNGRKRRNFNDFDAKDSTLNSSLTGESQNISIKSNPRVTKDLPVLDVVKNPQRDLGLAHTFGGAVFSPESTLKWDKKLLVYAMTPTQPVLQSDSQSNIISRLVQDSSEFRAISEFIRRRDPKCKIMGVEKIFNSSTFTSVEDMSLENEELDIKAWFEEEDRTSQIIEKSDLTLVYYCAEKEEVEDIIQDSRGFVHFEQRYNKPLIFSFNFNAEDPYFSCSLSDERSTYRTLIVGVLSLGETAYSNSESMPLDDVAARNYDSIYYEASDRVVVRSSQRCVPAYVVRYKRA